MASTAVSVVVTVVGAVVGAAGLGLGVFLASANNGWTSALVYSVFGLVCAPATAFSWGSRRSRRRQILAGCVFAVGCLVGMAILLEITQETSGIKYAWSQEPWAVAAWALLWLVWLSAALIRLVWFTSPRTHQRLSSRRGDGGR